MISVKSGGAMSSHFNWCRNLPRCFRLNHTLTQYLVIFGSLIFFYCLYSGGYHQLLSAVVLDSSYYNYRATKPSEPSVIEHRQQTEKTFRLLADTTTAKTTSASTTIKLTATTTKPATTTARLATTTTITDNPSSSTTSSTTFKSTCSAAADRRGPHQNVIGYSMYGKNFSEPGFFNIYLKFFNDILKTIPVKYPGWVVRIYHELKSDDVEGWKVLNKVLDFGADVSGDHIDLCNATQIIKNRKLGNLFEMTWRWLPMLDELVDTLMSRDSDSVIIPREQAAVAEWLASNKTFHIMRDNPQHCLFFVGCCWGVKISQRRPEIVAIGQKMFSANHEHRKGYDQDLLINYYRALASESMIAHDSYCCSGGLESQPYPTPRENGTFIGWQPDRSIALKQPCPEKCRPHNLTGPLAQANWTTC